MRKILLPLLILFLLAGCEKEMTSNDLINESGISAATTEDGKISISHFNSSTGQRNVITISNSALQSHLEHGDLLGDCSGVVTICDQDWMIKNLEVTSYRNGDPIPQVTDQTEWNNLTTGAWCYYNNDPANGPIYGKLYNLEAVNDPRGLAPKGWHIATGMEWKKLISCLDPTATLWGVNIAGDKVRSTGTIEDGTGLWYSPNYSTNSSGLTIQPGGRRTNLSSFINLGYLAYIWTSKGPIEGTDNNQFFAYIGGSSISILWAQKIIGDGASVRLVRD